MNSTQLGVAVVCLGVVAVAAVGLPIWDEPPASYTVEVVPAETETSAQWIAYSNLTDTEKQQFERSLFTQRSYDSRPALAAYASETIRYEDEFYTVRVTVAN